MKHSNIENVGIDFDNTIACYDYAFSTVGKQHGLLPSDFKGDKSSAKAYLLDKQPDGFLWESLQGLTYGRFIGCARMFDGVRSFLKKCRENEGVSVFIISHKTELAHHDPLKTNLRQSAVGWIDAQGLFASRKPLVDANHVFFADTRDAKVDLICELGCDVFIDDLPEVLNHQRMPTQCRKILFGRTDVAVDFEQYEHWNDITDAVFNGD